MVRDFSVNFRPNVVIAVCYLLLVPCSTSFALLPVSSAFYAFGGRTHPLGVQETFSCSYLTNTISAHRGTARGMDQSADVTGTVATSATPFPTAEGEAAGQALFVYGTLMNKEVLFALLGRVPATREAKLTGYHRYRIKDHVFPAIRPKEEGSVAGLFMPGLSARENLIFDIFEDEDYHKVNVDLEVKMDSDTEQKAATVYVWNVDAEDQLYSTWDPVFHFADHGEIAQKYVKMVQGFTEEIQEEGLLAEREAVAFASGTA